MDVNNLKQIFSQGQIKIFGRESSKSLLQKTMEVFGVDNFDDIPVNPIEDYNPYIEIIKDLIYKSLPNNILWNGIFRIQQIPLDKKGYEGAYQYKMIVNSKKSIFESLNPSWIYENFKLVEEFMSPNNEIYEKLIKFSVDNFPITIKSS